MIYAFDDFELDTRRVELRRSRNTIPVEPRVLSLLCLLIENRDRVVPRDEMIEKVWDGRFISEAALSTAIHGIRRALGDTGAAPRYLKTVRGHGFRFVAPVELKAALPAMAASAAVVADGSAKEPGWNGRPSIAVLPFKMLGAPSEHSVIGEALPAELISALSRLRWLAVVARGSTFRLQNDAVVPEVVSEVLGARYALSGVVEAGGGQLSVTVNLTDAFEGRILWGERYHGSLDDIHLVRASVAHGVVVALETQIPPHEAETAQVRTTEQLDAWGAYHLALRHMYRFTRTDNQTALELFARSVAIDPHFSRGYAGLSFANFQASFLRYSDDWARAALEARQHAERSVELDPLDPMGNFTLGRSLWLEGTPDAGMPWLERATQVNPNFAQGFYARAWADIMAGRSTEGRRNVDKAMSLSPIDPMLYAMQATRAITHLQDGDSDGAALWADRAARAPGSHYLVGAIAVAVHELDGNREKAILWANSVKSRRNDTTIADFFQAFPFEDPQLRSTLTSALAKHGF
ncbi:MAG: winged helix-turn-helix domain-containing protein [Oricola sp.]